MTRVLGPYAELIYAVTRIVVGMMYWMHGTTKLFGWPAGARGGQPLEPFSLLWHAGVIETVGGFMIMTGLFASWAAFICSGQMAAAYFLRQAPFAILPIYQPRGILGESTVFNAFFFLYVAAKGSGLLSIDNLLAGRRGGRVTSRTVIALLVSAGMLLAGTAASAHHGTNASYDPTKETTLTGVVTKFLMLNPHGQLFWDVKSADGKVVSWGGELHSIALLRRSGWSRDTLKAGDTVTVRGYPSRAGTPFMVVQEVVINGKSYFRDLPQ